MNLEEFAGMAKSLLRRTAMIPRKKNKSAGLVRLSMSKFIFIYNQ
jgi:hypothetical protein